MSADGLGTGRSPQGKALVVGAGLAGLSAAFLLCRAGWSVRILERRSRAGGELVAIDTPLGRADHSLHLLLGTCTATLSLLGELKQRVRLHELAASYLLLGDQECTVLELAQTRLRGRLGSAWAAIRGRLPAGGGKSRALRDLATLLLRTPAKAASAADYLQATGIHRETVAFLGEWTLGVFNAPLAHVDAHLWRSSLFMMFAQPGFAKPLLPVCLLEELFTNALLAELKALGAELYLGQRALDVELDQGKVCAVRTAKMRFPVDLLLWAASPDELAAMPAWRGDTPLPARGSRKLGYHIANLLLDWNETPSKRPFVFDPSADSGPPGWSQQHRLVGFRDCNLQWLFPAGCGRAVLVGSGLRDEDLPQLQKSAQECLRRLRLPAARYSHVLVRRHATWRQDSSFALSRSPARSHIPNLLLAGAWCDAGVPLSLEAAVRSARQAVEASHSLKPEAGGGVTSGLFL